MTKKKISFDIDDEIYAEIKDFCKGTGQKLSDYWRNASIEKLERDKSSMTIFIPFSGTIEKFEINTKDYIIDLHDASEAMQENVSAVGEGIISLNKDVISVYESSEMKKKLDAMLEPSQFNEEGKLAFFTKEKYAIKPKEDEVPVF